MIIRTPAGDGTAGGSVPRGWLTRILWVAGQALAFAGMVSCGLAPINASAQEDAQLHGPPAAATRSSVEGQPWLDGQLEQIVNRAVADHPAVAAAKASARASGADLRAARWQRFPSVGVEGLILGQRTDRAQANVTIEQPLWTGGRIKGSIGRAKAAEQAALAGYQQSVLDIALQVAGAYYEIYRATERQAILNDSLTQHQRMLGTMERRVAQEVSPRSDLELVRARTSQVSQQINLTVAQQQSAMQRLRELVGDPFFELAPELPEIMDLPPLDRETVVAEGMGFDPGLRRVRFEADVADADARIARAQALPQLNAHYGYGEFNGHQVGLAVRMQMDGGLSRFAAADAARLRQQSSEARIGAAERELRDIIVTDHVEYESAVARMETTGMSAEATQRVTESYLRQFIAGRRTWLDVMNAVREATTARIDALDARINSLAYLSRLMMRTGQWLPSIKEGPA
jgi:adhesin transport system outer membrane protein